MNFPLIIPIILSKQKVGLNRLTRAFTKSDVSVKLISMLLSKRVLLTALLSVISMASVLLLFAACDDSAVADEEIEQIEAAETGSADRKAELWRKWTENLIIPETWVRSQRPYSEDKEDGYSADTISNTYQQNWQGKYIYLAYNFRNEDGNFLCGSDSYIIFFFDNKYSNDDGYYIYYNTLPLKDEPPEEDDD